MTRERELLIDHYAPVAKQAADQLLNGLPALCRYLSLFSYENLVTAGMVGVLAGIERWDRSCGMSQKEAVRLWVERCLLEYLAGGVWVPAELAPIFGEEYGGDAKSQPVAG